MFEGSLLGNSITVPAIDSSNLTEIPCIDSTMPAEKSIQLRTTQSLNGIIVQAEQIQYGNEHTRLQVTVENNAAGSTIYLKEAYAIQNGTSHSQILSVPKFEVYQIADAIAPGQTAAGYIFFDPLDSRLPASVKVIIETPAIPGSTDSVFIFSTTRP
jgi:hypothetical protein